MSNGLSAEEQAKRKNLIEALANEGLISARNKEIYINRLSNPLPTDTDRTLLEVQGEPVSETIIRDRR